MHVLERLSIATRHNRHVERLNWVWDVVRPFYNSVISATGRKGLARTINGMDSILVAPRFRAVNETYEPGVWRRLMGEVAPGDVFADVGAHLGLYTAAVAKRVGPAGRVYAFEPDPANYEAAHEHLTLNGLQSRVELLHSAVGACCERVWFKGAADSGHIASDSDQGTRLIECVTLDEIFRGRRLNLLKIDVEGHEQKVLEGASDLLKDRSRCPRSIYIEVHPYAWPRVGTTSDTLLNLLSSWGYQTETVDGTRVTSIERYGEIIALKCE